MKKINIEVCCGNVSDVVLAASCGVDRIELNSALELGGLTPSYGAFLHSAKLGVPLMVMIRPRGAGFCYSEEDYKSMLDDAKWFIENGADGLVFGFLDETGEIDQKRVKEMLDIIGDKTSVFHKAIDGCIDMESSIEQLIDLGVDRILTAGGAGSVDDNKEKLAALEQLYGDKIEILPGGGVTFHNVETLVNECKMKQIHLSAKRKYTDIPPKMDTLGLLNDFQYNGVDNQHLKKVVAIVRELEQ